MIKRLWHFIENRRKKQFFIVFLLTLIASIFEIVSIGAVLPFLGVITNPEQIFLHHFSQPFIVFFNIETPQQLIVPITVGFVSIAIIAGVIRLVLLYVITRLSYAVGADLSVDIYQRVLYQGYDTHMNSNSSEIINGVINKTNTVVSGILTPILTLASSFILLAGIIFVLFMIDPSVALISLFGFGFFYWMVIWITHSKLKNNSVIIAKQSTLMVKYLQEGLGSIRDVIINNSQDLYCNLYQKADLPMRRAAGDNVFIAGSPRYAMDALGMVLIAGLAYFMLDGKRDMSIVVPILGAFALGAQKMLPTLQQAYNSYSNIKGAYASLQDIVELLDRPLPDYAIDSRVKSMDFEKLIQLNNLSFSYSKDSSLILDNLSLTIHKGSKVGIIGETGSGKSTIVDIIMGLLSPTSGELIIDGCVLNKGNLRSWQTHIAHVPQDIFLLDGTIEDNIAFGVEKNKIDVNLLEDVISQAQLAGVIKDLPNGRQSFIGEKGVRISGGQRQRIGIARALYRQANVLIFDEATSALDSKTEKDITKAIENLDRNLTVIIIAHRLNTLKGCDQIVKVMNSGSILTGSYHDLIGME